MLAVRVRLGEVVMVGHLAVSAARTGGAALCLVVTEPDGRSRRVASPAIDLLPGVTIDASFDARRVKLGISAPREIPIRRKKAQNMVDTGA